MKTTSKITMALALALCSLGTLQAQANSTQKLSSTKSPTRSEKKAGRTIQRKGFDTRWETFTLKGKKVKNGSTAQNTVRPTRSGRKIKRKGFDIRWEILQMNGRKVKTGGN